MLLQKHYDSYSRASNLVKIYKDLHFSYLEPTRFECPIDQILTNFPEKVIQSDVIEIGLSNHEFINFGN